MKIMQIRDKQREWKLTFDEALKEAVNLIKEYDKNEEDKSHNFMKKLTKEHIEFRKGINKRTY
jgi:hypothetical protein